MCIRDRLLAARLTRGRYAARWRCTAWLLLSLRLAVPFPLLPHTGPAEAPVQLTVPSNPAVSYTHLSENRGRATPF